MLRLLLRHDPVHPGGRGRGGGDPARLPAERPLGAGGLRLQVLRAGGGRRQGGDPLPTRGGRRR